MSQDEGLINLKADVILKVLRKDYPHAAINRQLIQNKLFGGKSMEEVYMSEDRVLREEQPPSITADRNARPFTSRVVDILQNIFSFLRGGHK